MPVPEPMIFMPRCNNFQENQGSSIRGEKRHRFTVESWRAGIGKEMASTGLGTGVRRLVTGSVHMPEWVLGKPQGQGQKKGPGQLRDGSGSRPHPTRGQGTPPAPTGSSVPTGSSKAGRGHKGKEKSQVFLHTFPNLKVRLHFLHRSKRRL